MPFGVIFPWILLVGVFKICSQKLRVNISLLAEGSTCEAPFKIYYLQASTPQYQKLHAHPEAKKSGALLPRIFELVEYRILGTEERDGKFATGKIREPKGRRKGRATSGSKNLRSDSEFRPVVFSHVFRSFSIFRSLTIKDFLPPLPLQQRR
jgi:hypothetical protein